MASSREVRTKIASVKNTQKITKAMQMVAASKMRKSQDRKEQSLPYAKKIYEVIQHLSAAHPQYRLDFMEQHKEVKRVGFIVLTTDRGLCGALNASLLRETLKSIQKWQEAKIDVDLCLVGNKADAFFKRIGGNVVAKGAHLTDDIGIEDLIGYVKVMFDKYVAKEIDEIYICFNKFINTMIQKPKVKRLLPIVPDEEHKKAYWDYIYEPDSKKLIEGLVNRFIEIEVYHAAVENLASEQASRMVAMMSATDNAKKLIGELQLVYNKARQAAITQEISEIVGGASAIS
jgi:F-type H+-transporting ATPase subunit gamma